MRFVRHVEFSRFPFQPTVYILLVGIGMLLLAAVRNPVAVALPIGGTVATTAMLWGIDQLQPLLSDDSATSDTAAPSQTCRDHARPCTADD